MSSLKLAKEREQMARDMLRRASVYPGADICDDAWMTAAIFLTLLDDERDANRRLTEALRIAYTAEEA